MTDLLSEELVEQPEVEIELEVEVPKPIKKKDGRSKERTPAQIENLKKAREAYLKKRSETTQLKKETKVKIAQMKVDEAKQNVKKIAEKTGVKIEDDDPKKDQEVDKEEKSATPRVLKEKKKKSAKPIVLVEQNTDSESEEDQPNVIFIKRKSKKKEAPVEPPIVRQPAFNSFGNSYFMRPEFSR